MLIAAVWFSAQAVADEPTILVLGDSLSAGYGMDLRATWPALLEQRLKQKGYRYKVVNASISGDTTRSGRGRLPVAMSLHRPAIVIIELGGNDGLRALPLKEIHRHLAAMIEIAQQSKAKVLLAGIKLPPNYGQGYTERFHAIYRDLAARYEVALVPFLLEGIGGNNAMMQQDLIHPRAEAQPKILENVWPHLKPLLEK